MSLQISNLVLLYDLQIDFDLSDLAKKHLMIRYDKTRFNGAIMKTYVPRVTLLVFRNGKVVCLGSKNLQDADRALKKLLRLVGVEKQLNGKIVNIVGTAKIASVFDLDQLAVKLGSIIEYTPELYPAAFLSFPGTRIRALVFQTGRIIITGGKSFEEMEETFTLVKKFLF